MSAGQVRSLNIREMAKMTNDPSYRRLGCCGVQALAETRLSGSPGILSLGSDFSWIASPFLHLCSSEAMSQPNPYERIQVDVSYPFSPPPRL
jgi:hypothetical protein